MAELLAFSPQRSAIIPLGHHPWWTRPQRQAEEGEATVMSIHTLPRNLNVAVAVDRDRLGES